MSYTFARSAEEYSAVRRGHAKPSPAAQAAAAVAVGMLLTLETRAAQAVANNLAPLEFLALLLDDELERHTQSRLRRLLTESSIPPRPSPSSTLRLCLNSIAPWYST